MVGGAVDLYRAVGLDPHESKSLVRFVTAKALGDDFVLDLAKIVVIILNKVIFGRAPRFLNSVNITELADSVAFYDQPRLLGGLADEGIDPALTRLYPAAGEFIIVVFTAVHHGDLAVAQGNTPRRRSDKDSALGLTADGVDVK